MHLVCGFNIGTFLHQQLCNFNMTIACCLKVMVSIHPVHAQNLSNTLLAIKYHKTDKYCSLVYCSISPRLHKPYPPSWKDMFHASLHVHFNASSSSNTINDVLCVHHANLTLHSSATIPTSSTCTCPYSVPMSMLRASMQQSSSPCQIWTMDAPFCPQLHYRCISCNQKELHSNCSCIPILFLYFHPLNLLIRLRHNTKTFKIQHFGISVPKFQRSVHARFNVPLLHLHRL